MYLKYTGPKPLKRVYFTHPANGSMEYTFNPICEINDSELAKFLLSPDRKGLFIIVDEPGLDKKGKKDSTSDLIPSKKAEDVKSQASDLKRKAKPREKANSKKLGAQEPANAAEV